MHLALFVHRVEGLAPGVYLFLRNGGVEAKMRADLSDEFLWQRVPDFHAVLFYRTCSMPGLN